MNIITSIHIDSIVDEEHTTRRRRTLTRSIPLQIKGEHTTRTMLKIFRDGYRHQEGNLVIPFRVEEPLADMSYCDNQERMELRAYASYLRLSASTVKFLLQLGWQ